MSLVFSSSCPATTRAASISWAALKRAEGFCLMLVMPRMAQSFTQRVCRGFLISSRKSFSASGLPLDPRTIMACTRGTR